MTEDNVVRLRPFADVGASTRLSILACGGCLDRCSDQLGNPADWRWTALVHLKLALGANMVGTVEVSAAALALIIEWIETRHLQEMIDERDSGMEA